MEDAPVEQARSDAAEIIVVGHDGSANADVALLEALDLAEDIGAHLQIVRAWSIETAPPGSVFVDGTAAPAAEIDAAVAARLQEDVQTLVGRFPRAKVAYRGILGHPSHVLLAAATDARMLVVGSRGRGGFASLVLGSVSDQCIRHAACPVLVVPSRAR